MATTTSLPVDLRGLVDDILVSKDTLGAAAAELRHLAGQTQRSSFGLVLEVVLPLLASSQTTVGPQSRPGFPRRRAGR